MPALAFLSPSPMELVVILVIALLVIGPSRLPDTARSIGRGWRELRDALQGAADGDEDARDEVDEPRAQRPDDPEGLPVDPRHVVGEEAIDADYYDEDAEDDDFPEPDDDYVAKTGDVRDERDDAYQGDDDGEPATVERPDRA